MTLRKPAGQQAATTFGRRGVKTTPGKAAATQRKPTISPRPEQRAQDAIQEAAQSAGEQVVVQASRGKAYFKACLAGTAAFIAALFALTGVDNKFFQAGPMLIFLAIPVLPTLALILYIPTVVLSDIARLLSIPRGWSDLGIGLTLGIGLGIATALSGTPGDDKSMMMALAMTAGGFIGGFAFWRAQGYPGTSSGTAAALDLAYEKMT